MNTYFCWVSLPERQNIFTRLLTRTRSQWTAVRIRVQKGNLAAASVGVRITSGTRACEFPLQKDAPISWGTTENLDTGAGWKFTAKESDGNPAIKLAVVEKTPEYVEFSIPQTIFDGNPDVIAYEWLK